MQTTCRSGCHTSATTVVVCCNIFSSRVHMCWLSLYLENVICCASVCAMYLRYPDWIASISPSHIARCAVCSSSAYRASIPQYIIASLSLLYSRRVDAIWCPRVRRCVRRSDRGGAFWIERRVPCAIFRHSPTILFVSNNLEIWIRRICTWCSILAGWSTRGSYCGNVSGVFPIFSFERMSI